MNISDLSTGRVLTLFLTEEHFMRYADELMIRKDSAIALHQDEQTVAAKLDRFAFLSGIQSNDGIIEILEREIDKWVSDASLERPGWDEAPVISYLYQVLELISTQPCEGEDRVDVGFLYTLLGAEHLHFLAGLLVRRFDEPEFAQMWAKVLNLCACHSRPTSRYPLATLFCTFMLRCEFDQPDLPWFDVYGFTLSETVTSAICESVFTYMRQNYRSAWGYDAEQVGDTIVIDMAIVNAINVIIQKRLYLSFYDLQDFREALKLYLFIGFWPMNSGLLKSWDETLVLIAISAWTDLILTGQRFINGRDVSNDSWYASIVLLSIPVTELGCCYDQWVHMQRVISKKRSESMSLPTVVKK